MILGELVSRKRVRAGRVLDAVAKAGRGWPAPGWIAAVFAAYGLGLMGFYYMKLLGCCSSGFFAPAPYGLTFNSMLLHLLQG